jgi:tight adherence protein B
MLLWLLIIGGVGTLALGFMAIQGPSASKSLKRRVELIKERHGDVIAGGAQAQIRKLFAERASKFEGYASTLIPKPALLRKRLEQTGKNITLGKYATTCVGVIAVVTLLLVMRGAPFILSLMLGLFCGIGAPRSIRAMQTNAATPTQIITYLESVMSLPVISSRLRSRAGLGISVEA